MAVDEIADIVARLDQLVPRMGACVIIKQDYDEQMVIGNWSGYMRLGIELLKSATAAGFPGARGQRLEPDLDYVFDQAYRCDFTFDLVNNPSYLTPSPTEQQRERRGIAWVGILLLIALAWIALKLGSKFLG